MKKAFIFLAIFGFIVLASFQLANSQTLNNELQNWRSCAELTVNNFMADKELMVEAICPAIFDVPPGDECDLLSQQLQYSISLKNKLMNYLLDNLIVHACGVPPR